MKYKEIKEGFRNRRVRVLKMNLIGMVFLFKMLLVVGSFCDDFGNLLIICCFIYRCFESF